MIFILCIYFSVSPFVQTKEVNDICFLDFQFSRFASPAVELLFHLFSSTGKSLRDSSYGDLLNIYYNSLSETIRKLGSDPNQLFRFPDLLAEMKAYGNFVLIMACLELPLMLSKEGEIADLQEFAERLLKGEKYSIFLTDGTQNGDYIVALKDVIGDVISYGYDY